MANQNEIDESERTRRAALAAEEEQAWYANNDYLQRQAEEEEAENRHSAIDQMVEWFGEQFEDPANQTPYEEGEYFYVFGGPFDANDVLSDQFGTEYKEEWIEAAIEKVQASGTFEWAPTSYGDYYERPERDEETYSTPPPTPQTELSDQILDRLDTLEERLASLYDGPPPIGHNQPPGDAGATPYSDDSQRELQEAIIVARQEVRADRPDPEIVEKSESIFKRIGTAIAVWVGKKLDLATDESIKAGVKLIVWTEVSRELLALAADLAKLIQHIR